MLYTTYFSHIKKIPEEAIKLFITRYPPKWFELDEPIHKDEYLYEVMNSANNTWVALSLSPSEDLLLKYKTNQDWNWFEEEFIKEMNFRKDLIDMLNRLEGYLRQNKDVYLVCFEKDFMECHRYLIAKYFEDKGFEWQELRY